VLYDERLWDNWRRRYKKVYVANKDFRPLIEYYDGHRTFFYLDPPYYISSDDSNGYYSVNFRESDHKRLRDVLGSVEGKFLLSYDDDPRVRELYEGFHIEEVFLKYQARGTQKKMSSELLISNYKTSSGIDEFF
jgi:DNA adenine methylase